MIAFPAFIIVPSFSCDLIECHRIVERSLPSTATPFTQQTSLARAAQPIPDAPGRASTMSKTGGRLWPRCPFHREVIKQGCNLYE